MRFLLFLLISLYSASTRHPLPVCERSAVTWIRNSPALLVPIVLIVLVALLAPPVDAQPIATFESRSFELDDNPYPAWLPLQVGNKWTYEHVYDNSYYYYAHRGLKWWYTDLSPLQKAIVRIVLEVPGYPYFPDSFDTDEAWGNRQHPPDSITRIVRRFTIEITHTEGHTYFVFSDVDYDWPPVPNLFFAGKKVGVTGYFPSADLYRFSPHHICPYFIPDYPLLDDRNHRGTLRVQRELWHADDDQIPIYFKPPASLSQEAAASFRFSSEGIDLGEVWFVSGYGLAIYNLQAWGYGQDIPIRNQIYPVSAVIDGKEIEYPLNIPEWTHVQPTSWGQVKAHYGQGP